MPVTELPQVDVLVGLQSSGSLATGELLLHYLKISAPLVEVLVSAVFGKSSLAAEVLLCWWSGKLSYTGKPSCTPVWSARKWDVSLELGKTRPSLFNPVTVLMYK
ncbi:uncharacterized protein [Salvelinus alpinus]|uniref:uncharacterized protein isoform X3 n=1 Tax=Salvelinus alpinus TaxID=8036 RepID=UPI0039FDD220